MARKYLNDEERMAKHIFYCSTVMIIGMALFVYFFGGN